MPPFSSSPFPVVYLDPPPLLTRGLGGACCSRLDDSGVRNVVGMDGQLSLASERVIRR